MSHPRFFTEHDVTALLSPKDAVHAVEEATRDLGLGLAWNSPRQRTRVPGGALHLMAATWPARNLLGYKAYAAFKEGVSFLAHAFDATNGTPLAVFQANTLGQLRTGAATAVAVKHLAAPGPLHLCLVGAGFHAWGQLACIHAVRPIARLQVVSRKAATREAFCERARSQLGVDAVPMEDAAAAVKTSNVVVTCTTSSSPVVQGEWLNPGTLVCGVGANSLTRRELDAQVLARSAHILVDSVDGARLENGALQAAAESGRFHWEQARELGAMLAGHAPGRTGDQETITVFTHGLALWDVAAMAVLLEKSKDMQLPHAYPAR